MIRIESSFKKPLINLLKKILKLNDYYYVFAAIVGFYLALWFFNPGNYIVVASYGLLFLAIYYKLRDFKLSFLVTYLASTIVFSGKSYYMQLVPYGVYDTKIFPNGYLVSLTVTPAFLLGIALMALVVREVAARRKEKVKIKKADLLLLTYLAIIFISDLFVSRMPEISFLTDFLTLPIFILYFYIKQLKTDRKKLLLTMVAVFSALTVFETAAAFQQFAAKAPTGKTLELQRSFEYTGTTHDEINLQYTYRPTGTFDHANTLGMNLAYWVTFIFIFYLYANKKATWAVYAIALGVVALASTLSRSAWIGFVTGGAFLVYFLERVKHIKIIPKIDAKKIITLIFASAVSLLFIFPRLASSIYIFDGGGATFRLHQISAAWQMILSNPLLGVGTQMVVPEGLWYAPNSIFGNVALEIHNWYISLATNNGLPAVILFIAFVVVTAKKSFARIRSVKIKSFYNFADIWFIGAVLIFFIIGIFATNNGYIWILTFAGILNSKKNEKN